MKRRITVEKVEPLARGWAKLDRYTIRYTRGDGGEVVIHREVHDHGHGATVLPYDTQRGTVLLVRQFRLPAYLHDGDGFIIEACAGLLDGDDPAQCAKREAEEELGFRLANLRFMTTVYATPGAVTERLSLFIADYDHQARIGAGVARDRCLLLGLLPCLGSEGNKISIGRSEEFADAGTCAGARDAKHHRARNQATQHIAAGHTVERDDLRFRNEMVVTHGWVFDPWNLQAEHRPGGARGKSPAFHLI